MEYLRHGRCLVPVGGIYDNLSDAVQGVEELKEEIQVLPLNQLNFQINENSFLTCMINDQPFFWSHAALKELCKLLKVPASFVNKFAVSHLVTDVLNRNPYLTETPVPYRLITWQWEEGSVIVGIMPLELPHIPVSDLIKIMQDENAGQRPGLSIESIVLTGEEVVVYYLMENEMNQDGFTFKPGYSIHYPHAKPTDTAVFPFYQMAITTQQGELFDFDFESSKKVHIAKRKKKDFESVTIELATQYAGEDLGVDFSNTIKKGMLARQLNTIRFALLKTFKSKATSVYGYSGMKVQSGAVIEEIIPEFKQFVHAHEEQIRTQEKYETNTMLVDFYMPVFLNRMFTFRSSMENAYFLLRYRRAIGTLFDKALEEAGDIILS
ncbi:MAG: hypothetical protein Kow0037_24990 [Calditrichia bacterium]